MDMNAEEKQIYDSIVGRTTPTGKVRAIDAAKALKSEEWKQWLRERERDNKAGVMPIHGFNADGEAIRAQKYDDRLVMCEMYSNYLKMAQMDQKSKYTFIFIEGKQVEKPVIQMTFDEFLNDGLKNLDWVETEDIPMKLKFHTESPIGTVYGISKDEAKFSLELVKRLRESIKRYLKMDEADKLIYASEAIFDE